MKDALPELPDDLQNQITELRTTLVAAINNSFETNCKLAKLSEQMNDLQVAQKQTDERLSAVISTIEKFLSDKNNI